MKKKILKILFIVLMILSVVTAAWISWVYYLDEGLSFVLSAPWLLLFNSYTYSNVFGLYPLFLTLSPYFILFAILSLVKYLKTGKLSKALLVVLLAFGVFYIVLDIMYALSFTHLI